MKHLAFRKITRWLIALALLVTSNSSLLISVVSAQTQNAAANGPIKPIVECVINNGNGAFTAYFGYNNRNRVVVTLPVGGKNKFTPDPQDRGQPTNFQPGHVVNAFVVTWNGSDISWTLKGPDGEKRTATANSRSAACTPTPTPVPPTNTPAPPTATSTNTPVPPTATPTDTPLPPTNTPTNTPVPPTDTPTNTPVPPTETPTNTLVPPTNTPTNTPVPPTDTPTNTPVPPTETPTNTPVPPTDTPTNTPVPPTETPTNTPVPPTATATDTPAPPTATPTTAPIQTNIQIISAPANLINVQCPGPWNFTFSVLAADMSQGAPTGELGLDCSPLHGCPLYIWRHDAPGPVTISIPSFVESVGETLTLTYYYTPDDPTRFAPSSTTATHVVVDELCVQ